jgi:hypothetical protein
MKKRIIYRSAITGRFVSRAYAEANPDTTCLHVVKATT